MSLIERLLGRGRDDEPGRSQQREHGDHDQGREHVDDERENEDESYEAYRHGYGHHGGGHGGHHGPHH